MNYVRDRINILVPNARYFMRGDDYDNISWMDRRKKPTKEELENVKLTFIYDLSFRFNYLMENPDCVCMNDIYESTVWRDNRPIPSIEEVTSTDVELALAKHKKLNEVGVSFTTKDLFQAMAFGDADKIESMKRERDRVEKLKEKIRKASTIEEVENAT